MVDAEFSGSAGSRFWAAKTLAGLDRAAPTVQDLIGQAGLPLVLQGFDFVALIDSRRNNDRNNRLL